MQLENRYFKESKENENWRKSTRFSKEWDTGKWTIGGGCVNKNKVPAQGRTSFSHIPVMGLIEKLSQGSIQSVSAVHRMWLIREVKAKALEFMQLTT